MTKNILNDIVNEKFGLEKLIITKSLRGFYKNPNSIAHKVLADRIGKRDPGNKPSVGDRIPYVYIQTKKKVMFSIAVKVYPYATNVNSVRVVLVKQEPNEGVDNGGKGGDEKSSKRTKSNKSRS